MAEKKNKEPISPQLLIEILSRHRPTHVERELLTGILLEIAPFPNTSEFSINKRLKEDFYIVDDKTIRESVEHALAQKINKAVNIKRITNKQYNYHDSLVFAYCRVTKKLNHPIIKARLDRAIKKDDTDFFVRLGEELNYKKYKLTRIKDIMIWGWVMSIHRGIPPLCQFDDNALFEFFNILVDMDCSFDSIRKTRQRLGLVQSENRRVSVWS